MDISSVLYCLSQFALQVLFVITAVQLMSPERIRTYFNPTPPDYNPHVYQRINTFMRTAGWMLLIYTILDFIYIFMYLIKIFTDDYAFFQF